MALGHRAVLHALNCRLLVTKREGSTTHKLRVKKRAGGSQCNVGWTAWVAPAWSELHRPVSAPSMKWTVCRSLLLRRSGHSHVFLKRAFAPHA